MEAEGVKLQKLLSARAEELREQGNLDRAKKLEDAVKHLEEMQ